MNALRTSTLRASRTARLGLVRSYASDAGSQKIPTTGQSSAYPSKGPEVDRHHMSQAENVAHATKRVNQFAKRDPSLYPLSIIVVAALGVAGYFFATKATGIDNASRGLQMEGLVNPWDDKSKLDTHESQVAAFKYRHKTRDGHYEDALPTLSEPTVISRSKPTA